MKRNKIYLLFTLTIGIVLMALIGCTEDGNELTEQKRKVQIVPAMGTAPRVDITRAATDQRFGDYIEADAYPVGTKIGVAFYNLDTSPASTTLTSFTGVFSYQGKNKNPKWSSSVKVDASTNYKVLGHVPSDCSTSFSYDFADKTDASYENKTYNTITLTGIKPVSNTDVSVIVGVGKDYFWKKDQDHTNSYENANTIENKDASDNVTSRDFTGAYPCNFNYLTSDGKSADPDPLYLLMDHLFVQTKFYFRIAGSSTEDLAKSGGRDYHALRDIRIRKVWLSSPEIKSLNATIYLESSPVAPAMAPAIPTKSTALYRPIEWEMTKYGTGETPTGVVDACIYDCEKIETPTGWTTGTETEEKSALKDEQDNGYMLNETATLVAPGFFSPIKIGDTPITYRLTVEYDVYDKKKNKIREETSAVNFYTSKEGVAIERGHSYDIHITVMPTYLYQLSDGDLDNPTLKITTP